MSAHAHPLGTVESLDEGAIESFAAALDGDIVLPDGEEYDDARNVWNGLINKYPAVVARAENASDVAESVAFAREHDLALSVSGGAHNQTGSAVVNQGVVVDLSRMDGVGVDPDTEVARVGPGARAEDVLAETQEYGLAAPTGSAGDVGIAGSTLGGGIGWIRRKHGLGIDALRRVEIVTPDGEILEATPEQNADLFWALRGGGGNFGVVTEFEFDLYEVGPMVQGLGIFYPADLAEEVMDAHSEVVENGPEELTTILLSGHVPNLPPMPDELAGTDAVAMLGAYAGDPEDGTEAIAPLREIGEPLLDMSDVMPYEMLHDLGTQMYPSGRKYTHRSVFVDEFGPEIREIVREQTEAAPAPMAAIGVWPLGGNIGDGSEAAYPWNDKQYMITVEGNWEAFENRPVLDWAAETDRLLREAGGEGAYAGFTGVEERDWEDWAQQVYGDSYDRLATVKAEYDPENVFSQNVTIDPEDA
ncbi:MULTISPECIES: FAD-binding oxidoreductase [Halolamina]|uniref:FAD/FMN-containing dehydrogenase n=1 Tax=Halolamina pelagica TaxID=699431 RepID=A0A1I5R8S1_9EURY|nr:MULTISPECIES: FAD-binding oxidoreductase [Halolamina]NHX35743.1 FAD-binding oxidoreductase [Halolamina sp. R1-12]SFP54938.1 FAD/FMN-containing dehydrogenase [Halolamina pelagica]